MSGSKVKRCVGRETEDINAESLPVGICECDLAVQNDVFSGTGGISRNNRAAGFIPAYLNTVTGEAALSCHADGSPAAVHVLDGLPDSWVCERDASGVVTRANDGIVAGFMLDGRFYTREAAAQVLTDGE